MSLSTILVLLGDGVGPEDVEEALKVLRVVDQLSAARFNIQTDLFGGCSIDVHGVPITEAVLQKAKEADAVEEAVRKVLDDESRGGLAARTGDIGGKNSTAEVGDAITRVLEDLLSTP